MLKWVAFASVATLNASQEVSTSMQFEKCDGADVGVVMSIFYPLMETIEVKTMSTRWESSNDFVWCECGQTEYAVCRKLCGRFFRAAHDRSVSFATVN